MDSTDGFLCGLLGDEQEGAAASPFTSAVQNAGSPGQNFSGAATPG